MFSLGGGAAMDVNQRIRHLMEERGWTSYRLAKESHLSDATVGNLFRRNTVPSMSTLEAICSGLGITLSQFFAEGDMVEVTPELKELFDDWAVLSTDQKEILRQIIKGMKKA
jgi:transcriptional regulator with XRE-family HTH domain